VRAAIAIVLVASSAACQLLTPGPIGAGDCFGDVPYSFVGWTTKRQLGIGPEDGRIYALVTRDEVELSSMLRSDGRILVIRGRGACFTDTERTGITLQGYGSERRLVVDP
jgi:hypothetical protein